MTTSINSFLTALAVARSSCLAPRHHHGARGGLSGAVSVSAAEAVVGRFRGRPRPRQHPLELRLRRHLRLLGGRRREPRADDHPGDDDARLPEDLCREPSCSSPRPWRRSVPPSILMIVAAAAAGTVGRQGARRTGWARVCCWRQASFVYNWIVATVVGPNGTLSRFDPLASLRAVLLRRAVPRCTGHHPEPGIVHRAFVTPTEAACTRGSLARLPSDLLRPPRDRVGRTCRSF